MGLGALGAQRVGNSGRNEEERGEKTRRKGERRYQSRALTSARQVSSVLRDRLSTGPRKMGGCPRSDGLQGTTVNEEQRTLAVERQGGVRAVDER